MTGTVEITAKIDTDEFIQELHNLEYSFVGMLKTMKKVAYMVREYTVPRTPFETGKLGRSFKYHVLTDNNRMKVLQVEMSALNERTGYNYAWIQHENTSYSHYKPLSAVDSHKEFGDAGYWDSSHRWFGDHGGEAHYLKEGIIESQEGAFELIEDDYISLFYGSFF